MLVTEEEAKKKWCPQRKVRVSHYDKHWDGFNIDKTHCIADKCMMWQQDENYTRDGNGMGSIKDVLGYCGLAG